MSNHVIIHRKPLGEAVCSCGEMFESGTPRSVIADHERGAQC